MNLRFTLPDGEGELMRAVLRGAPIVYCVPFDLSEDGEFSGGGWVVVTKETLYILRGGAIEKQVVLRDTDEIECIVQIDNGQLAI